MLALTSRRSRKNDILGNGILYGFGVSSHDGSAQFLVETDFGNHMRLTAGELDELFKVREPIDYQTWLVNRSALVDNPRVLRDDDRIVKAETVTPRVG